MKDSPSTIQVWCDIGGTFTDCFVVNADHQISSIKVLSSGRVKGQGVFLGPAEIIDAARRVEADGFWNGARIRLLNPNGESLVETICRKHDAKRGVLKLMSPVTTGELSFDRPIAYELEAGIEAPVLAARLLLGVPLGHPLPPIHVRLGTTRGTNSLLTRRGASTALVVTRGFGDILQIGYQERPELFKLHIEKRRPLFTQVIEVQERLAADGSILTPLDVEDVHRALARSLQQGIQSLAICLLHSYRNSIHEQQIAEMARGMGFLNVSVSSELAPMIKFVSRAETTVVDAYLSPVVQSYLARVDDQLGNPARSTLHVMTSHGGLVDRKHYRGKDSVLSGPAGGAVALTHLARSAKYSQVIGLDMGGTSTDVCRIDGTPTIEHEAVKAGVRLMTPMLAIHTVAAGGGSVCFFDGVQWRVGPQSAAAEPGPACYGRGGPLTVTDLNLLLGRIVPSAFPFSLDTIAARRRLDEVLCQAGLSEDDPSAHRLAYGLRRIANEHMAAAVRKISIAQGADPRRHVLIGFGGAAGQHICEIADILKMKTILDPLDAGLLSALGMGMANVTRWATKAIYSPLGQLTVDQLNAHFIELEQSCLEQLREERIAIDHLVHSRTIEMRYAGTDQAFLVDASEALDLERKFSELHHQRFGYLRTGKRIEVIALRVETAAMSSRSIEIEPIHHGERLSLEPTRAHLLYSRGEWVPSWVVERHTLRWGHFLTGPGIVLSKGSTTVIDSGWSMEVLSDHSLKICKAEEETISVPNLTASPAVETVADPILREVLAQRLSAIADSMGVVLEQTAISVNVKERRDYSCAVFTADGDLLANAPHVPVHLGAMSETVKRIIELYPEMELGDSFITNNPYQGGSHLPDVTVVTPIFSRDGERWFFTASRAHHAEIGGMAPGSMSPLTQCLEEEGVILPPMKLVERGIDRSESVRQLLGSARFPSRSIEENLSDIAAQLAANRRGAAFLLDLVEEYRWETVAAYQEHILSAAETKVRRWIQGYEGRVLTFADRLDDDTPLVATLRFHDHALDIDFQGTGPVSSSNFNANPAIVTAAVMYVIRTMIDDELPLNSGVLRPIRLSVPHGLLNPYQPNRPLAEQPAVAAGNVETSQRIVDCLLGALGVAGASQGTMNNLLLGNERFGYYETIGGGAGATERGKGADAVHTHMTNTRLTDPEILETRYPVRLSRFEIRKESGGNGRHRGGNGLHRELLLLEDLEVSLVTSRRGDHRPYGMAGGESGAAGENYRVDRQGRFIPLPSTCQLRIAAGERIGLKTPGGGGFGFAPPTPEGSAG